MIYWDTSCVLKLYSLESDSAEWERCALETEDELVSSMLLDAELAFALQRKEADGDIRRGAAEKLLTMFRHDVEHGRLKLFPLGHDVIHAAGEIARECIRGTHPINLRTLDGLHLATALLLDCTHIASADTRMRHAAHRLGIKVITPNHAR